MDLVTAQNIFAVRLYEWSQRDLVRELEEGCPLLCSLGLNNRSMAAIVDWNETLTTKERKALAIALTRYTHENAARLKGETMAQTDKDWYRASGEQMQIRRDKIPPLKTADKRLPGFQPVNREQCMEYLVGFLSPVMGKISRRKSKVTCTRQVNKDWKIITEFKFFWSDDILNFVYQFIRKDGGPVKNAHPAQGPFPRTLLLFYGLWDSSVQVPSQADSEPMAKVMARLAEHFVAQADPLFEGLGVND